METNKRHLASFPEGAQAKGRKAKRDKLTAKEKAFAHEYVKTRNGTQSALKVYDVNSCSVAGNIASVNLRKPKIKEEIERLLRENDIEITEILRVHKRNMVQEEHLPTSQKAVTDFYEILGLKSGEKPTTDVKVAFIIES